MSRALQPLYQFHTDIRNGTLDYRANKPDQATMRPGCVSTCIEHVKYIGRQMDALTDEMTE